MARSFSLGFLKRHRQRAERESSFAGTRFQAVQVAVASDRKNAVSIPSDRDSVGQKVEITPMSSQMHDTTYSTPARQTRISSNYLMLLQALAYLSYPVLCKAGDQYVTEQQRISRRIFFRISSDYIMRNFKYSTAVGSVLPSENPIVLAYTHRADLAILG